MNETTDVLFPKCKIICITCLKTTNDLYPMSLDLKTEYNEFVEKLQDDSEVLICNICSWQFRKCLRFKQQCQAARNLMKNAVQMVLKPLFFHENLSFCHNLETTKTEVHCFTENATIRGTCRRKNPVKSSKNNSKVNVLLGNNLQVDGSAVNNFHVDDSTGNNLQDNSSLRNNLEVNSSPVHTFQVNGSLGNNFKVRSGNNPQVNSSPGNDPQVNSSPGNDPQVNGSSGNNPQGNGSLVNVFIDNPLLDYGISDAEFNDDDEKPLVLLKGSDRRNKKKGKRKEKVPDEILSEHLEPVEGQGVPRKRAKKELKEGFSSRMVQETDEYVVIKLTKDQVLQEMGERSKTEAYLQSPFKCDKCVKGFNFQDVLLTHMDKHTKEVGSFQCEMCTQYCRSAVSLRGHVKSHTTRYKCKLCGVIRLSRQHLLEHHAITHMRQAVTYSCDTCKFSTIKRTVMQRHVKSHATPEPHACDQCGKLFKSIDSLRVHTMRHDKSSRLRCHCGVSFVYHSLLRRHVSKVHERREYYCVECDAQFKSSESLRLHFKKAKKHRDSSSYKHACEECGLRFFTAGALGAHAAQAHGAARAHACAVCRRLYCSKDALRAHAWRAHATHATDTL